jgi:hypothetical protein
MFEFDLEAKNSLLTVIRTGQWTLNTVAAYETALRQQLRILQRSGPSTSFIIDIRSTGAQPKDVADELRAMVRRLGTLQATRTAVVTATGIAKLQAMRVADANAEVFTSMVLARDWVLRHGGDEPSSNLVHDQPSDAEVEGRTVHVHGPSDLDINLTHAAAIETAKRIGNVETEAMRL